MRHFPFIFLILLIGIANPIQSQVLDAEIRIASDYNFRGLYQHFNENNRPSSQLTAHSQITFWSEVGFMLGGETANVHDDFEVQGKAGFKLPLGGGSLSAIHHSFQYQKRTSFEEIHYVLASSNTSIAYIQGLYQAGDAILVDYQHHFSTTVLDLRWGDFKPSTTQLGLNTPGNGEFYTIALAQPFLSTVIRLSYTDRYNIGKSAWIISLSSTLQQPIAK